MSKRLIIGFFLAWTWMCGYGQGTSYTLKGGLSGSFSEWIGFNDNPLISPHMAVEIESFSEDDQSSLFAALGYYTHGTSTNLSSYINTNGDRVNVSGKFKVNNLELTLGAKGKKDLNDKMKAYYSLGIRGGYNISDNFDIYLNSGSFRGSTLDPFYLRSITYGITAGGGIQYQLSDRYDGVLELNINPDIAKQYEQPPLTNVPDPFNPGTTRNFNERSVRNLMIVLTVGIRLIKY